VNKVELIGLPSPVQNRIVDFEAHVRGNPLGLAGREVSANNFDIGITVREFTVFGQSNWWDELQSDLHRPDTWRIC
jgi:hypothetical protein